MDNGDRLVGDAAKNQATINPENTVFDVKRLIGRNFSDKSVQADKKHVPYEIVSDQNKVIIDREIEGRKMICLIVFLSKSTACRGSHCWW